MKFRLLVALLFTCLLVVPAAAQKPQKPNPDIQKMIKEVSAKNIQATILKLVSFGTRNTLSSQDDPKRGIGAARDWIYGQFEQISKDCGGCLDVEKQTFTQPAVPRPGRFPHPAVLTNIYAVLKGTTDPDRVYVVSGHYDSMCNLDATDEQCDAPGANDDGSGTAASIELARVMSKYKFDATIIFMTVPGEEQSLTGSTYFAKDAAAKKMNIEAMLDNDIIGGVTTYKNAPDRQTIRVFSEGVPSNETPQEANSRRSIGGENDSQSRQLARYVKEMADIYSPKFHAVMIYRRDRYGRSGDHVPFLENGFAAVRFTEPHEDYTHQHQSVKMVDGKQYGDLPEFVDYDYIANATRINLITLANLALAPAKPKNVSMPAGGLTNDTTIKWDANTDADLAGYEIVWRDTTSPVWTNSTFVGNVTTYTAKEMSKDNYFFGVRALDKAGNKSPVVFPKSGR
ncbi:MAG: M28 family metallopeptidase [Acidobacteria bacterium]|nr:M28 family metallopeptidase [Acidobacteriota bacterium]